MSRTHGPWIKYVPASDAEMSQLENNPSMKMTVRRMPMVVKMMMMTMTARFRLRQLLLHFLVFGRPSHKQRQRKTGGGLAPGFRYGLDMV